MRNQFETFIFESFEWRADTLHLRYSLDEKEYFEETWTFPTAQSSNNQALMEASKGLWLMAGISYFKAAIPGKIQIKGEAITPSQTAFFEKTYLNGLGEFFYQNQITPFIPSFPSHEESKPGSVEVEGLQGTLIPLGGGKDSLVSVELLKQVTDKPDIEPLSTWTQGVHPFFEPMIEISGLEHINIKRKICPNLIKLNNEGALNGHVPISSIWAFASTISALRIGKKYIAFSNESSANEPTLFWDDLAINHQYSKTLEFEQDFQHYLREFVSPSVHYFSFLRPLTELNIAQTFCSKCFNKYQGHFASCNRNFKFSKDQNNTNKFRWCGECPKCAFVGLILSPFLSREALTSIFDKAIFESEGITQHFPNLLGLIDVKPFECIGEVAEAQKALHMAYATGEYPELEPWISKIPDPDYDYQSLRPHSMPSEFYEALTTHIS